MQFRETMRYFIERTREDRDTVALFMDLRSDAVVFIFDEEAVLDRASDFFRFLDRLMPA